MVTRRRTAPDSRHVWTTAGMLDCLHCPEPWKSIDPELDERLAVLAHHQAEQVAKWPRVTLRYGPATLAQARRYAHLALEELTRLDESATAKEDGTYDAHAPYAQRVDDAPRFHVLPGHAPSSARGMHKWTNEQRKAITRWLTNIEKDQT